MTFHELYKQLDKKFPSALSAEWDNDGIMCADDLDKPVSKILISLDITEETVKYACDNGFDTVISHHPLVFKSQKSLVSCNFTQKKLITLIKNGVRAMSFHTRLDAADGGVNDTLANLLGFSDTEKDPSDSIGRICTLDKETELSDFAEKVKLDLCAPYIFYVGRKKVKRLYIVGGDGKDMISNALACQADTLLTGNASYNSMLDAEEMGLNVIEAGHFYTENPVCKTLEKIIKSIDEGIKTEIFMSNRVRTV